MRVPVLLIISALCLQQAGAAPISDADRETLLDNLEKIEESADSKVDAKIRVALAAYRSAVGSDDAAIALYLNCMEKTNFEERNKKAADFRDWKRKQSDQLANPGTRLALRHQLQWLILTVRAAQDKDARGKLAGEARDILNSTIRDMPKMRGQENILGQDVLGSAFARAYEINHLKVEGWPGTPIALDSIYNQIIFPPLRRAGNTAALHDAWLLRIQQEGTLIEAATGGREGKLGPAGPASPEMTRFNDQTKPQLQWQMEVDMYQSGDQSGAAVRMLALLQKNLTHPAARQWGEQLKNLLKPPAAVPAAPADAPLPDDTAGVAP